MSNSTHNLDGPRGFSYYRFDIEVFCIETDTPGEWIEAVNPVEVRQ